MNATAPTYAGWTQHGCPVCLGYGECMPGDSVVRCSCCHGWGGWWRHDSTGTLAAYPGGPLMGREPVLDGCGYHSRIGCDGSGHQYYTCYPVYRVTEGQEDQQ